MNIKYVISENVNGILQSEEIYIEILLDTVSNISPLLLGPKGIKKLKSGELFIITSFLGK